MTTTTICFHPVHCGATAANPCRPLKPKAARVHFTERAFVRSHGKAPSRRVRSSWAFQATSSDTAYDRDLFGEIFWSDNATLGEAKQAASVHFATLGCDVAVLP